MTFDRCQEKNACLAALRLIGRERERQTLSITFLPWHSLGSDRRKSSILPNLSAKRPEFVMAEVRHTTRTP
jgi:hypothetical protein